MDGVARNYLEAISAGFSYRDPPPSLPLRAPRAQPCYSPCIVRSPPSYGGGTRSGGG